MMTQTEMYIKDRMDYFAQDIDNYDIGDVVLDYDDKECVITNKTLNSLEVFIEKKSDKGANTKQWFSMNIFNKRFKRV